MSKSKSRISLHSAFALCITASLIFIGLASYLEVRLKSAVISSSKYGLTNEVLDVAQIDFANKDGSHLLFAPSFSGDGLRLLMATQKKDSLRALLLWEEGEEPRVLYESENLNIEGAKLSSSGKVAIYLLTDKTTDAQGSKPAKLYLWEEGFGQQVVLDGELTGQWSLSISESGNRVAISPLSLDAEINAVGLGDRIDTTAPFILSFGANGRQEGTPLYAQNFQVISPIGNPKQIQFLPRSDSALAFSEWRRNKAQEVQLVRYKKGTLLSKHPLNDMDGDDISDLVVFSAADPTATWRAYSMDGFDSPTQRVTGHPGRGSVWRFGPSRSIPVQGDYNGDGVLDMATFLSAKDTDDVYSLWHVSYSESLNSHLNKTIGQETKTYQWGIGDPMKAAPGDYDGDGITDIAVYYPPSSTWYIAFSAQGLNLTKASLHMPGFGAQVNWGRLGSYPIGGDYDGDRREDLALWFEPEDEKGLGLWQVYYLPDKSGNQKESRIIQFGHRGDIPMPADYNGDGTTDLAVYRPAKGEWIIRFSQKEVKRIDFQIPNGIPISGDFDGDGASDIAFYTRGNPSIWYILPSGLSESARNYFPNGLNAISSISWGNDKELPAQVILRDHQRQK